MSYIEISAAAVIDACDRALTHALKVFNEQYEAAVEETLRTNVVDLGWFKGSRPVTRQEAVSRVLDGTMTEDYFRVTSEYEWIQETLSDKRRKINTLRDMALVAKRHPAASKLVRLDRDDAAFLKEYLVAN